MDGFSYIDIFETKGIEYLVIIGFFAVLIPFWIILNKKGRVRQTNPATDGVLTARGLRVPQGLFYSKNHTWAYMEQSGNAKVGLDDLLLQLTGDVSIHELKKPGDLIRKGDLLTEICQNGKTLKITSPISGKIMDANNLLEGLPGLLNDDPYKKGWIYKIKPANWVQDINTCFMAETATNWATVELERFKDFLANSMRKYSTEPAMIILQDGGEICNHPLTEMPDEIWKDFQHEFLN